MTARSRLLSGVNSPPPSSQDTSPSSEPLNAEFVVILAALLCALICVLGLVTVARCSWIRRISGRASTAPASAPPVSAAANKGLKKKVLKALPKHTYGEDKEQAEKLSDCAICLAEFSAGEEIRVLPQCGHGFHVACIDMWLGSHSSCPSCRQILLSARCHKCGSMPAASSSGGGAQTEARECRANRYEYHSGDEGNRDYPMSKIKNFKAIYVYYAVFIQN